MSLRDHPETFDVGFLAGLFGQPADALSGFDFAPVGTGQVGDSYRVTLDWAAHDDGLPKSLVAKCPAADAVSRDTARNMNLYEIETKFYQHFGTNCGARVPHVYLADYQPASGDGLLLFEDMAPAQQIAQMDGCSLTQVEAVLNEAALCTKAIGMMMRFQPMNFDLWPKGGAPRLCQRPDERCLSGMARAL